jgi:hypothetical protein
MPSFRRKKRLVFASPPLWLWAIIIGLIVAGKFAYRWRATKVLARQAEEKKEKKQKEIG